MNVPINSIGIAIKAEISSFEALSAILVKVPQGT
jgi:hypothetical protein